MLRAISLVTLVTVSFLGGCREKAGQYVAAASISDNGFARNGSELRKLQGREVGVWGFVDHGNLYGNEDVRSVLADYWSGKGPSPTTWRFNLKANAEDPVGRSFPVYVRNDAGRDRLLAVFLADAKTQRPTKVFLQGRLFTFDAPGNMRPHTGLYIEVPSSKAIRFDAEDP